MTQIGIEGENFTINGKLTYSEIAGSKPDAHGLLMNARFIQGIFDDREAPERFARFGWSEWDPERHTNELVAALPEWHRYGLRAITVGFQGGMPVFTINNVLGVLRACQRGIGVALLPDYLVEENGGLVQLFGESDTTIALDAYFVYPEELKTVARVQVFRDFLVAKAQRWHF